MRDDNDFLKDYPPIRWFDMGKENTKFGDFHSLNKNLDLFDTFKDIWYATRNRMIDDLLQLNVSFKCFSVANCAYKQNKKY